MMLASSIVMAAPPPDAGVILEETKLPPLVAPQKLPTPPIKVDENRPDQLADDKQQIPVKMFHLKGTLPVPETELIALLEGEAGKDHTLRSLNALAGKLTTHLQQQGFMLAFAYVPAQEINEGNVDITVVPGQYGQIRIEGNAHLQDAFLHGIFHAARTGGIIMRAPLERALLIADEIPGLQVRSTLAPGKTAGTADLTIVVTDTGKFSGAVYADNWGSRYTGRVRYGTQISLNNLSGTGDSFTLGGLSSFQGLNDYDFGYNTYLGTNGLKISLRQSQVNYILGDTFADMNATGTAVVTSAGLSYPLVRRRAFSLAASLGYDHKKLIDDSLTPYSHIPKTDNLWNFGLSGNFSDTLGGGGANAFSFSYSRGNLSIDDDTAQGNDAVTAQTAGTFGKFNFVYQRQQFLRKNLQMHFTFAGQLADKNLDSSEKFYLGGPTGVRAYPQSEAAGDQGYRFNAEMRWRIPGLSTSKSGFYVAGFYVAGFFDCGSVLVNKNLWSGAGDPNRRSLSGAGLGLLWTRDKDYAIRLDYAWKTSAEAATSDTDQNGRIWWQGVKYF